MNNEDACFIRPEEVIVVLDFIRPSEISLINERTKCPQVQIVNAAMRPRCSKCTSLI